MAKGGYRGNPMGGMNMNMIKQAQKMQQDMMKMQAELEEKEYEGTAGGGVVKVKMNGKKEITEVKIAEEVVDPEDIEMLEDLVLAAVNEVIRLQVEDETAEMGKITGGGGLPF